MAIPACDENGFLPPGFHDCTLAEIEAEFCYSEHRRTLFAKLRAYCGEWLAAALNPPVYVNGGFATRKPEEPNDIDVVVDIQSIDLRDPRVCIAIARLLDHDEIERDYGIEAFAHHPVLVTNDFRMWFSYVKPQKRVALGLDDTFRKGMLRIQL